LRIHLIVNVHRRDAIEAARRAALTIEQRGVECAAEEAVAAEIGVHPVPDEAIPRCDFVISFGGDGTLIRAAHLCSEAGTPILGVYFGRFGFVTQCVSSEFGAVLSELIDGQARTEDRMMLQGELLRGGMPVASLHALNEITLQRSITARMLTFDVIIDGMRVASYPADGVLVSTPTGSSAYNLSAGGPIVDPTVQVLLLTAIAPHTLSARPLVLKPDSEILLHVRTEGDAVFSADGHTRLHLLTGDSIRVTRSPRVTRLISVERKDFLNKLGDRLFWGQAASRGVEDESETIEP
jgi:NAD+ kinase